MVFSKEFFSFLGNSVLWLAKKLLRYFKGNSKEGSVVFVVGV